MAKCLDARVDAQPGPVGPVAGEQSHGVDAVPVGPLRLAILRQGPVDRRAQVLLAEPGDEALLRYPPEQALVLEPLDSLLRARAGAQRPLQRLGQHLLRVVEGSELDQRLGVALAYDGVELAARAPRLPELARVVEQEVVVQHARRVAHLVARRPRRPPSHLGGEESHRLAHLPRLRVGKVPSRQLLGQRPRPRGLHEPSLQRLGSGARAAAGRRGSG